MVSRFASLILLSFCCLAPGMALAEDITIDQDSSSAPDVETHQPPRTSWVWVDPIKDLAADAVASEHISKIIYINQCVGGCTIQPGVNDARNNTSSIVDSTSVLSAFDQPELFDDVVDCIRDVYSPYDVQVVTEDPGPEVFHHEAILAGSPEQIGLGTNIGGIAPAGCAPLNNVISFSFANGYIGRDVLEMCWTVAQESAHAFGLPNHVFNCLDPMTYIPGCGKKYFRNQSYQCGETEVKPCNCSGATQNSHVELRTVFGDGTQPPPPTVSILLPNADDQVNDGFVIFWDAQDERLVDHSDLFINGSKYSTVAGHDYNSRADNYDVMAPTLPDGYIDIEIKAYNGLGSEAVSSVRVLKGSPCTDASSCFEFQECNAGRCEYPAATSMLGESCDIDFQCAEGVCGAVGSSKSCTTTCNPTVGSACADGFECTASDTGGFVCWPKSDSGGCCSVAGTKRDPLPWFGMGIFLVGILVLRRRRHN
jgi:MYXO-CTERM domain-containing protein